MSTTAEKIIAKIQQIQQLATILAQTAGETVELLNELKQQSLAQQVSETTCPQCGGTNLFDVSAMGNPEFRCEDCQEVFQGEIRKARKIYLED